MASKILILGGGVGGTIVANRLARKLRADEATITVIDAANRHFYQPGFLYLPFNEKKPDDLARPIASLLDRRIQFINEAVTAIDKIRHTVQVGSRSIDFDLLVLAMGARLVPERVPGFETTHHFYDAENALRLRNLLETTEHGRIVIGPSRKLYKCPPAPLEFTLLLDDYLRRRRIRKRFELCCFSPFPEIFHFKAIAKIMDRLLAKREIEAITGFNVKEISQQAIISHEGKAVPFDIAVIIPPHRVSSVLEEVGLAPDGWIPVDPASLQVRGEENIFALGDVTDLSIPKTGAVAHVQAQFVVQGLLARLRHNEKIYQYDGRGVCLIETGAGRATTMRFDYHHTSRPPRPALMFHWAKILLNQFYWQMIPPGRF